MVLPVGTTTILTGPSGAGKSTLADVIGGLVTPDTGELRLDGTALDPAARRGWREQVAYVQQEPVLFHTTIRENLRWAFPAADDAALDAALRDAAAHFVFALPEGLDTLVGDRGGRLSGGERQRIALARGLLRAPALLILDNFEQLADRAAQCGQRSCRCRGHRWTARTPHDSHHRPPRRTGRFGGPFAPVGKRTDRGAGVAGRP